LALDLAKANMALNGPKRSDSGSSEVESDALADLDDELDKAKMKIAQKGTVSLLINNKYE